MQRPPKNAIKVTCPHCRKTSGLAGLLDALVKDPTKGLPEDIFLFASRITPLINVDLLIKDKQGRTLLTWRNDGYSPAGWHIPGGIIRFKETFTERIKAVAASELGSRIRVKAGPLVVHEIIFPSYTNRAHGVSLLYECVLASPLDPDLKYKRGTPCPGQWAWHETCPDDLLDVHEIYRSYISP
jgi:colanic acid biosynthesis protein WcaH